MIGLRFYLAAGAALAIVAGLLWTHSAAYRAGARAERVTQLEKSVEAFVKRNGINAEVDDLDAVAVCIELGGVPDDCEQLRGMVPAAPAE